MLSKQKNITEEVNAQSGVISAVRRDWYFAENDVNPIPWEEAQDVNGNQSRFLNFEMVASWDTVKGKWSSMDMTAEMESFNLAKSIWQRVYLTILEKVRSASEHFGRYLRLLSYLS